ncbi:MAG: alpha/beta hydrolase [Sphingopyxis sp.]|nr:alpha/beta hydrolase [Sphingopyxis sp.]
MIGDSAGGGLALALAQRIRDNGLVRPAALSLVSPWADLTLSNASITAWAATEMMLSQRGLALDADRYRGAAPADDPRVSPLLGPMQDLPPTFIQVGSEEMLFDDARLTAERVAAAGGDVHLQIWDGMAHAWPAFGAAVPEAAASIAALGCFCRRWLSGE